MATSISIRRSTRAGLLALVLTLPSAGCFGYRLMRADEIEIPSYDPREVLVPARCDSLITRAAIGGMEGMQPSETSMINFCQQQQLVRAQEEEAVARKLEAHAETASFALRLTTVVVGSIIAVVAWVL